jgi:hypothetical protein
MRLTEIASPVATANGYDTEFGDDDGGTNGCGHFLGGFDSKSNVSLGVSNDDNGLESSTLTGTGLLLDRLDLYGEGLVSISRVGSWRKLD